MNNVTKSNSNNILSPNGNSLAVFVDTETDELTLKDINGITEPFSNYLSKFGSFYDTTTQTALGIDTPTPMKFNTTDISNGVSIEDDTKIVVEKKGYYNIQFSAQLDRVSGSGVVSIEIWFRKNGIDIPNSNTRVTMSGNINQSHLVASWNYISYIDIDENIEIMWNTPTLNIKLVSEPADTIIPYPAIPSVILTTIKIQ
jgi:hypothetical protein